MNLNKLWMATLAVCFSSACQSKIYDCPKEINLNDSKVCQSMDGGKKYRCTFKDAKTDSSWVGEIYVGSVTRSEARKSDKRLATEKPMVAKFFDIDTMSGFGCEVKFEVGGRNYYTTLKNDDVTEGKCEKHGNAAFSCKE